MKKTLPAYRRRTQEVDALIAGADLAGTNTRRVGRALAALFKGAISKSTVSRVWRKIKADWESWNRRDLSDEDIVRLILDGTVVKVRLDRKATSISLLVVLGVRRDGQKVLLAVANMGGESEAGWRKVLDDLSARGLKEPELAIVDGAPGLEKALVALWNDLAIQRCTVHKFRNLIAHAPKKLADEIAADYSDMIYYEGTTFKAAKFGEYVTSRGWFWPRLDSGGALQLDRDAFKDMARSHPEINDLHELRTTLGKLRLTALPWALMRATGRRCSRSTARRPATNLAMQNSSSGRRRGCAG